MFPRAEEEGLVCISEHNCALEVVNQTDWDFCCCFSLFHHNYLLFLDYMMYCRKKERNRVQVVEGKPTIIMPSWDHSLWKESAW